MNLKPHELKVNYDNNVNRLLAWVKLNFTEEVADAIIDTLPAKQFFNQDYYIGLVANCDLLPKAFDWRKINDSKKESFLLVVKNHDLITATRYWYTINCILTSNMICQDSFNDISMPDDEDF